MLRRTIVLIGALTLTVIAAPAAAGGGGGCHGPVTDGEGTTVEITSFCFTPTVVRVEPGDTVTWVNNDDLLHNVFSSGFSGSALTFNKGESYDVTFDEAGVFPYVCTLHAGMMGTVVVGDADVPTSAAAVDAVQAIAQPTPAAASVGNDALEQRMAVIEASLLATPAPASTDWPPLIVGLLAGAVLSMLLLQARKIG